MKSVVWKYLSAANGKYYAAVLMIQDDLDKVENEQSTLESYYKEVILHGAFSIILSDPNWDGDKVETVHPDFITHKEIVTEVKTETQPEQFISPLLPANIEKRPDLAVESIKEVIHRHSIENIKHLLNKKHDVGETPSLVQPIPYVEESK